MKLRIRSNSVRIRLTRTEVARLATGERIEQVTQFSAASSFYSSIEASTDLVGPLATFDGIRMELRVPSVQMRRWAESDEVGIEAAQQVGSGKILQLLIEKDFECLHSRAERDGDAFPHPRKND